MNQPTDTTRHQAPEDESVGSGEAVRLRPPRHRVDRRAISWWTIQALLIAIPVIAAAWVAAVLATPPLVWLAAVAVTVIGIGFVVIDPRWSYAVARWEVTEEAVYTRTGWFVRQWRIAPMSRIQRVDSQRGPLQQLFGLASVSVTTASSAGTIRIEGLDHELARDLVEQLTRTTHATPGDAT